LKHNNKKISRLVMTIQEIIKSTGGEIKCGEHRKNDQVNRAFCSDLMSDVLTLGCHDILLITGLSNVQAIRTAEMADISYILFVRDKNITDEMLKLAAENNMVLAGCKSSMFKVAGELYAAGIQPVY
jgi:hypothetical protein